MSLLLEKNRLFNKENFLDWKKFTSLIKSQIYRDDVTKLLNTLKEKSGGYPTISDKTTREFVGAYTMLNYDEMPPNQPHYNTSPQPCKEKKSNKSTP